MNLQENKVIKNICSLILLLYAIIATLIKVIVGWILILPTLPLIAFYGGAIWNNKKGRWKINDFLTNLVSKIEKLDYRNK